MQSMYLASMKIQGRELVLGSLWKAKYAIFTAAD